jgi:sterol desaturase/sphingolipid hydroxylase (fatty acid hydroxylase superfamily)
MENHIFTIGYAAMTITYFTSKLVIRHFILRPTSYISSKIYEKLTKKTETEPNKQFARTRKNDGNGDATLHLTNSKNTAAKVFSHMCMYCVAMSLDSGNVYSNFSITKMFFQREKTVNSTFCIIFSAGFLVLFDFCYYVLHRFSHVTAISRTLYLPECTSTCSRFTQPVARFAFVTVPSFLLAVFVAKPPINVLTPLSVISSVIFATVSEINCLRNLFVSNEEEHQICKKVGFGFSPFFDRLFKTDLKTLEKSL